MTIQTCTWIYLVWWGFCVVAYHNLYGGKMTGEEKFFNALAASIILPICGGIALLGCWFMFHALCGNFN